MKHHRKTHRLDALGEVVGGRQRVSAKSPGRLRPYLRVANVYDGRIDSRSINSMPFTDAEFAKYRLRPNDVLLNEGQSLELVGRAAMYRGEPEECAFQNSLIRIRPYESTDPRYLEYLCRHLQWSGRFARVASRTTSIAHLGVANCAALRVHRHPTAAQRRIADVLDAWQARVRVVESLAQAAGARRRGLMNELLTGKRRFPEFAGKPWRDVRLGEVLHRVENPAAWNDDVIYGLLSVRRRSGGVFLRERKPGRDIKGKSLFTVRTGDVLISRMQVAHGALALVPPEFDGGHVSGMYDVLQARNDQQLSIRFFAHLTRLPSMYRKARLACHGVHIEKMTFSLRDYLRTTVTLPPVEEQRAITRLLDLLDAELAALGTLADLLKLQKRALMDRLFGDGEAS